MGEGTVALFLACLPFPLIPLFHFAGSRHKIGKGGGHVVPSRLSFPLREINTRISFSFLFPGKRRWSYSRPCEFL